MATLSVEGGLFGLDTTFKPRPFVKWAGGKTRLLSTLVRCVPRKYNRYFEPFLGGGALFFAVGPRCSVLNDSNRELINCYKIVRDHPEDLEMALSKFVISEEEFYRIRSQDPDTMTPIDRAARFIFLNKTCFNGVYRVNKRGQFNTPFGHYSKVSLFDSQTLGAASIALSDAKLLCGDYKAAVEDAIPGDFIYFDPPYLPVSKFSDFKRYTKEFFYESDHEELASTFAALHKRGCLVLLSNSHHPKICALYQGFEQRTIDVPRYVNCRGDRRGSVKELLIANFKLPAIA